MSSVESRIVTMKFNNSDFKRGVSETISQLGKLKNSFGFKDARTSVANLNKEVGNFSLGSLAAAPQSVSKAFLAMSTVAITALANITNRAIDAGIRIVKSLSFDQIAAGFAEYELKLGSIQTIMAGSGESLDVVNQKLDELNTYADRTIYSFADMTQNIGKFTNAGVDLDTSVASIQGIANVAAVSGANANEASRAMYNFAQALSKGYVQLIDWKSIELANMGTVEFKQQLIDAAEAQGTLTKEGDKWVTSEGKYVTATQGFNDSLTDQWLTTEVLNQTLGDYADETTEIGKKAFAAAQDVKTFTQLLDTIKEAIGSGWARSFEILIGDFDEAKELFTGINNVVSGYVDNSADARNELLQTFKDLGGREALLNSFKNIFEAVKRTVQALSDAFRSVFPKKSAEDLANLAKRFEAFTKNLIPTVSQVRNIRLAFKGFLEIVQAFINKTNLGNILDGIRSGFAAVWDILKVVADAWREVFPPADTERMASAMANLTGAFKRFMDRLRPSEETLEKIRTIFVGLFEAFKLVPRALGVAITFFKDLFLSIKEGLGLNLNTDILGWLAKLSTGLGDLSVAGGKQLAKFGNVTDGVRSALERLRSTLSKIAGVFEPVLDYLKELGSSVITNVRDAFAGINWGVVFGGIATGSFAGIALAIRKFLKDGIQLDFGGGFLDEIREVLGGFSGVLEGMQQNLKANALIKIAGAIAILALSLLLMASIDAAKLAAATAGIAAGMSVMVGALATMDKYLAAENQARIPLFAAALLLLSVAILVFAGAMKVLSTLDWEGVAKGLAGITGGLAALIGATKLLVGNTKGLFTAGIGLIFLSGALILLATAMKIMSTIDFGDMITSLIGLGGALGIIVQAMRKMPKGLVVTGLGLIVLATGLLVLAAAVKIFSLMDVTTVGKGLLFIGISLGVIIAAMYLMPPNMLATAASLLLVAVALTVVASAVQKFGSMSIGELAKGLIAMALALLILGVALATMSATIPGALALVLAAFALGLLVPPLIALSQLSWGELLKALLGLAGALTLIGIAAAIFGLAAPLLLLGGAALLVFGVGLAAVAVAAFLFATALGIAVEAASKGSGTLKEIFDSIIEFIPKAMQAFAEGIVAFVQTIADAVPDFVKALSKIISGLLDALIKNIPKFDKAFRLLLDAGIKGARDYIPQFIQLGLDLLSSLLDGLIEKAPKIVNQVADLMVAILNEMKKRNTDVIDAGTDVIISFIEGLSRNGRRLTNAAFQAIVDFINGLADGVERYLPQIKEAGRRLANAIIDGLFGGLSASVQRVVDAARQIATGAINTIKAVFGIRSPSRVTAEIGRYVGQGLANGIGDYESKVARQSSQVGQTAIRSLKASVRGAGDIITDEFDTSPTITPVLDLSQVTKDTAVMAKSISGQTIRANASIAYASTISDERAEQLQAASAQQASGGGDVIFNQTINSPRPLTTIDIYRNTKSQLSAAKEGL